MKTPSFNLKLQVVINSKEDNYRINTLNTIINLTDNKNITFEHISDSSIVLLITVNNCSNNKMWYYYRHFNNLVYDSTESNNFSYVTLSVDDLYLS